ncbi:MAG: hypothetical protein HUJ63_04405, partial [Enterococcus sp.]|nr:hypothetical protein [Enterococcus sp.]
MTTKHIKNTLISALLCLILSISCLALSACDVLSNKESDPTFDLKNTVALCTYNTTRHNVITKHYSGFLNIVGTRDVWWEYDASVNYSIDFNKVNYEVAGLFRETIEVYI